MLTYIPVKTEAMARVVTEDKTQSDLRNQQCSGKKNFYYLI